ncbi:hypothetical protein GCM10009853_011930 [Glycomyces scopariae]
MSEPEAAPAPGSADAPEPAGPGEAPAETPREEQAAQRGAERPADAPAADPPAERSAPPRQLPPVQRAVPPQQPLTPAQYQQQVQYYRQMATQQPVVILPNPRWHRPDRSAPQLAVIAAFAVALFAAWSAFPGGGVGIGLALTGIALVAVPLAASGEDLLPRLPGAVLVAALWSVAAVRDAGWVVALCAVAAFALTPLALAPQRKLGGTLIAVCLGWLEGIAESVKWAKRGRPSKGERGPGTMRMLWTAGVTVCLLLVFGGLFAAADSTFADLVGRLLPDLNPAEVVLRLILAAVLLPVVVTWIYAAVARPVWDAAEEREHRTVSRFELALPLGALNLLFALFIGVQLRVYFGGEDYVMETAGLTFAEYARHGFWQLSAVAVLALAVIAAAAWLAPKRSRGDRWTVRVLLGLLALMSMTVVASATFRMYTYTQTFGLTRLRVWIFTVEFWLAVLFALVLVGCWRLRATWLPRAVLASGALTLLGLAAANPDAMIARYNIEHDDELDVDLAYLSDLSADAAPALMDLPEEDRECVLRAERDPRVGDPDDERPLMAWNWGHQRALGLVEDVDEPSDPLCFTDYPAYDAPDYTDEGAAAEPSMFTAATCDSYDLAATAELFGTSATGDRGLENDDAAQFANAPSDDEEGWYLQCGFYGPGSTYLLIDVQDLLTPERALAGVDEWRAGSSTGAGAENLAELDGSAPGFTTWWDSPRTYSYVVAEGPLLIQVRLNESAVDATAEAVAADLADQTYALYEAS